MSLITIRLSKAGHTRLKTNAAAEHVSMGRLIDKALAAFSESKGWIKPKNEGGNPKSRAAIQVDALPKKYRRRGFETSKKLCTDISAPSARILEALISRNIGQAEAVEDALKFYFRRYRTVEADAMEQFLYPSFAVDKWTETVLSLPAPPKDVRRSRSINHIQKGAVLIEPSIFLAAIIKPVGSGPLAVVSVASRDLLERCKVGEINGFYTASTLCSLADALSKLDVPAHSADADNAADAKLNGYPDPPLTEKLLPRILYLLKSPLKMLDITDDDFRMAIESHGKMWPFSSHLAWECFRREAGVPPTLLSVATWGTEFDGFCARVFKPLTETPQGYGSNSSGFNQLIPPEPRNGEIPRLKG